MNDRRRRRHVAPLRVARPRVLVADLDEQRCAVASYDDEWSIGQCCRTSAASRRSSAFDEVLAGRPRRSGEVFPPIWDVWNAKAPLQWRDDRRAASEQHVARFEALTDEEVDAFAMDFFGRIDLAGLRADAPVRDGRARLGRRGDAGAGREVIRRGAPSSSTTWHGRRPHGRRFGSPYPRPDRHAAPRARPRGRGGDGRRAADIPDGAYDGSVDLPAAAFLRSCTAGSIVDTTPEHSESAAAGPGRPALGLPDPV